MGHNVPLTGAVPRIRALGVDPVWVYMQMAAGQALNGNKPRTALVTADQLVPEVSAGKVLYGSGGDLLTEGGFFSVVGKEGKPYEVMEAILPGTTVFNIADSEGTVLRVVSSPSFPMKLAAGEYIKITGGTTGGLFGLKVREEITRTL